MATIVVAPMIIMGMETPPVAGAEVAAKIPLDAITPAVDVIPIERHTRSCEQYHKFFRTSFD